MGEVSSIDKDNYVFEVRLMIIGVSLRNEMKY